VAYGGGRRWCCSGAWCLLDYNFALLRTVHTGIVAVAEWYDFKIPIVSYTMMGAVATTAIAAARLWGAKLMALLLIPKFCPGGQR